LGKSPQEALFDNCVALIRYMLVSCAQSSLVL
jgi:hypothetical protein